MGFQYELLESFSDHSGYDIVIKPENHTDRAISMLRSGEADILAISLTVNKSVRRGIKYTGPVGETRQVLVQRKPKGWQKMTGEEVEKSLVRDKANLKHKTVYVQGGSVYAGRLRSLSREIGGRVDVVEVPLDDEVLIQQVDRGEIDYTVCDENVALVNASYYPGIDVGTPVSQLQELAWAVRKADSKTLLSELNEWLAEFRKTTEYAILYAKYFRNDRSGAIVKSEYFALNTGRISRWDEIIKVYSESIGWDWRLLASLICQESRFNPQATSPVGAYGLMQVMPETEVNFGIDIRSSPQNNIKAGTRYIKWLHSIFDSEIADRRNVSNSFLQLIMQVRGTFLMR
jgi:membrane-bound lytic murein transglycosylase F